MTDHEGQVATLYQELKRGTKVNRGLCAVWHSRLTLAHLRCAKRVWNNRTPPNHEGQEVQRVLSGSKRGHHLKPVCMTTDKSKLKQQEREIQKELHAFIRNGDRSSDEFWNKHDELNKVQMKLYSIHRVIIGDDRE